MARVIVMIGWGKIHQRQQDRENVEGEEEEGGDTKLKTREAPPKTKEGLDWQPCL